MILGRTENRDQAVSLFRRVVEQDSVVGALYCSRKISGTTEIPASDILRRNVMASSKNAIPDSCQINLDTLGADVHQHDFETDTSRLKHHEEIVLPSESCLDSETLSILQMFSGGLQDLSRASDWKCGACRRLERSSDGVWV